MSLLVALVTFYQGFLTSKAGSSWPDGTYGLPQPITGCPDTHDVTWKTGWRTQLLEKSHGLSISYPSHLNASLLEGHTGIMRSFCIKTNPKPNDPNGNISWPAGKYCIYKYGSICPTGMVTDSIHWSDSKKYKNGHGGVLPKGKYSDDDTTIEYCCHKGADWDKPIDLPVDKPFYLLPYKLAICQHVKWAISSIERAVFSTEIPDRDNLKVKHVYMKKSNTSITAYYCYYKACRSTFKATTGWFTSNYTSDQYCSWTVVLEKNRLIFLKFSHFHIPDCTVNYLDVYDGVDERGSFRGRYCGSNASKDVMINSTSNALFVILKSGGNFDGAAIRHVSFKAEYTSMVHRTVKDIPTTSIGHRIVKSSLESAGSAKRKNETNHLSIIIVLTTLVTVIILVAVVIAILYKRRMPRTASLNLFKKNKPRTESDNPIYEKSGAEHEARNNPLYSSTSGATYEELPLKKTFLPVTHNTQCNVVKERHYEEPRV